MKIRKLRRVGGSVMIAIPPRDRWRLGAHANDPVALIPVDGGLLLTMYDAELERDFEALEQFHRIYRDGLRRFAASP